MMNDFILEFLSNKTSRVCYSEILSLQSETNQSWENDSAKSSVGSDNSTGTNFPSDFICSKGNRYEHTMPEFVSKPHL